MTIDPLAPDSVSQQKTPIKVRLENSLTILMEREKATPIRPILVNSYGLSNRSVLH